MQRKRKICVVITARPSYSRIKSVLTEIKKHPKLELQVVTSSSAVLDRYGSVSEIIEKDGFNITSKVYNVLEGENLTVSAKTTGLAILELASVFDNIKPDIVVSIADRFETIATAIAASYMNIPLAHIQGGEVTGNIDEKVRHAVTKLSDYHLVATDDAKKRVLKLGENKNFIFNTGCPSIDIIKSKNYRLDFNPIKKYGGVGYEKFDLKKGYAVILQHPVTNEYEKAKAQIQMTLDAVYELNLQAFVFWPNVDAGSDGTSNGIRSFREKNPDAKFHFFKNMEPFDFIKLIKNSEVLIGNSSVGIRESSYLGVPVVNIGSRQSGRLRAKNVVDVIHNKNKIKQSILSQIKHGHYNSDNMYGNGGAGKKIADILSKVNLIFHKRICY